MIQTLIILAFWIGNTVRIPVIQFVHIPVIDLLVTGIFIFHLPYLYKSRLALRINMVFKTTLLFLTLALLSLLINSFAYTPQQIFVSLLYLIRLLMYMSILFIPLHFTSKHNKILISGFILLGLLQYFLYPNLRNLLYLGWDDHYLRLFGTLLDPNFTGVLLGMMIVSTIDTKTLVLGILSSITLLLTYSRSAYLAFFVSMTSYLLYIKKTKYVLIMATIFFLGILVIPKKLPSEGVDLFRTASIGARAHEYQKAIRVIEKNPLFGVGYNAYAYTREENVIQNFPQHSAAGVPNSYLFIFATTGIFGFISFPLWLYSLVITYGRKNVALVAALVLYMISGLFDNTMVYPFIMFYLFLLLQKLHLSKQ